MSREEVQRSPDRRLHYVSKYFRVFSPEAFIYLEKKSRGPWTSVFTMPASRQIVRVTSSEYWKKMKLPGPASSLRQQVAGSSE